jgi:hypothetical protein
MRRLPALLAVAASLVVASSAAHAERYVIVNGARMNDGQIAQLERVHCGPFPNGNYWLNTTNGV